MRDREGLGVALVCPYSLDVPGGVGTHVLGLAAWLASQGHEVRVVAPGTRAPRPDLPFRIDLLGPAVPLPYNGSVARLALRSSQAHRASRLVADADVVHVHEPLTPGVAFAVARLAPRLVVTHHACFHVPAIVAGLLRMRAGRLGRRVAIAVSEEAARTALANTGMPAAIIPNGIEVPPPRRPRAGGPVRVGFLGRITDSRKGFGVFRAAAVLARGNPGIEFVAAGPGSVDGGPVRMLGEVADRWDYLQGVDLFVAPNLGGESFGMVLVEALASGCNVVASDLPAFAAVLSEAGVGLTFPAGDAQSLLDAVYASARDPLPPDMARGAGLRWSWDRVGPHVVEAYLQATRLTE